MTSAWAPTAFQLAKLGVPPAALVMKAAWSIGRNSPQRARSALITPVISAPSAEPPKFGSAIGIGSVRARLTSITAPAPPVDGMGAV